MIFKNDIFLSLSDDSYIKFWNLNDDLYLHTLAGHSSWVLSAIIMKDGTLLTTGADKTIKFWTE
jgi:WD40 repeat protein